MRKHRSEIGVPYLFLTVLSPDNTSRLHRLITRYRQPTFHRGTTQHFHPRIDVSG